MILDLRSCETPPIFDTTIIQKKSEGFLDKIEKAFAFLNCTDFFSGLSDSDEEAHRPPQGKRVSWSGNQLISLSNNNKVYENSLFNNMKKL
jgi:hypothetical protein